MRAILVAVALALSACGSNPRPPPLPGGYQLIKPGEGQVVIADKGDHFVAGPRVTRIGVTGNYIVVECDPAPEEPIAELKTVGFNVIDVSTRQTWLRLSEGDAEQLISQRGAALPEMQPYNSYRIRPDRGN